MLIQDNNLNKIIKLLLKKKDRKKYLNFNFYIIDHIIVL